MVTLADVARRANVSKMTVSRVINHPEQVTDELKKLVLDPRQPYSPKFKNRNHLMKHKENNHLHFVLLQKK